jgi:hypothetical protein
MRLFYIKCLFLITTLSFSQAEKIRVFKQQINTSGVAVLFDEDKWIFAKEIYSETEMIQSKISLDENITIDNIFKEHSFSKKLKYKYFICTLYIFKENFGLIIKESFIANKEYVSKYKTPYFKTFNFPVIFESPFNCETKDVVYENIVCEYNVGGSKVIIEYNENNFYTSIFNNECILIERIKVNRDDLNFLIYKNSFFLKSEDYIIVYSEGNSSNSRSTKSE